MADFRHELSEAQWRLVEPVLPPNGKRGGQWLSHRELLDAMFWKLNTGSGWRDLPERYGPWQSVYDRFRRWERGGTFAWILSVLRLQLDELGRIDWDTWCVEGSNIRAGRAAAGAKRAPKTALGRSHGGWGSKIHLLTDGGGLPLEVLVSAGRRFAHVLGDKSYSAPRIQRWLTERAITNEPRLPQAVPLRRHTLRQAPKMLLGHDQTRLRQALSQETRFVRHYLKPYFPLLWFRRRETMDAFNRITRNPAVMNGKACIRGMRVTVGMIVNQIGAGHSIERLLMAYPYLEREDILQALRYAAWRVEDREATLATA